jgi:hypothetical protein
MGGFLPKLSLPHHALVALCLAALASPAALAREPGDDDPPAPAPRPSAAAALGSIELDDRERACCQATTALEATPLPGGGGGQGREPGLSFRPQLQLGMPPALGVSGMFRLGLP